MKAFGLVLFVAALLAACGGPPAKAPRASGALAPELAAAFQEEAIGDPVKAVGLYVRALDDAAATPRDPASVGVAMAALDALVHRDVAAFDEVSSTTALAHRVAPSARIDERLARVGEHAEGPFIAGLVAHARLALAEQRGDASAARALRAASGCAREAWMAGPVAYAPVTGVREPSALDRADAPLPARVAGPGPFTKNLAPATVRAFGCRLPLYAQTRAPGVRELVVDVDVPEGGAIGVGLRSASPATLRAGGKVVIDRPYAAGGRTVTRLARVDVTKGTLRLVARVGMIDDYADVQIVAWDASGKPLRAHAPAAGSRATARATSATPVAMPEPKTDPERLASALAALAAGEDPAAEDLLEARAKDPKAPPTLLLAYGRAVRHAADLPSVKVRERARAAYDGVLERWPNAWEAIIEHAVLAGARRAQSEARLETLADLGERRAKSALAGTPQAAIVNAFEAAVAGREGLYRRARARFDLAKDALAGTEIGHDVARAVFERTGKEAAAFECAAAPGVDRSTLACANALAATGDRAGAERERERLRALADTPQLYLSMSSRDALEQGDRARAAKIYAAMNPGDRQLSTLFAIKGKSAVPELIALAPVARDAPTAVPRLLSASGLDPRAAFEGVAERVTSDPDVEARLKGAATAVLEHDERYEIHESGLVHFIMLDVRRVMGTTDVSSNAQASAPMLLGQSTVRVLRRRIFKKDGRILLPDRTPHAAQSHADLSQLEAGDAVEAIYEGYALPSDMGNVGVDTPDLFPERTTVRDARVEIRLPRSLEVSLWSHPLLGKAHETVSGDTRVLSWHVEHAPPRRLEAGVPKMDRRVSVSLSTTTWKDVARGLRETIAALDADSNEVSRWAHEAAKGKTGRALVEAVVAASGDAVKEASGMALADIDLGQGGSQTLTARTSLATHEGSRTWLVVRALEELGIPADIVVAEDEPYSDSPTFPPHVGRFMHPLAIAHLPAAGGAPASDVWIDADVPGPPLPAGRISPELRGRMAMWPNGTIAKLPAIASGSERDEIDIRLKVDESGDAKGSLTVLLRGRSAQDLAEALVRLVGAERQRALRGISLGWLPFATVDEVELSSSEGSWQVAIRAELSAPAYAEVEGTTEKTRTWVLPGLDPVHYVFPRPYVTTLSSTYASQGSRSSALAINRATQYHVRRRVELPAKASIVRVPGPFEGKGPLFSATRKITVAGTTLEEDFTLDVTTGTVPREGYEGFVKAVHRTDDAFRASTRVKPPG